MRPRDLQKVVKESDKKRRTLAQNTFLIPRREGASITRVPQAVIPKLGTG